MAKAEVKLPEELLTRLSQLGKRSDEIAEKMLANKETDKSLASMIKREIRDEKAVKTAIKRLYNGDFVICEGKEEPAEDALEQTKEAVEAAAEAAVSVFDDEDEEEEIEETEEA